MKIFEKTKFLHLEPTTFVKIRFEVDVPLQSPMPEKIWLSGNVESLGRWNGKGLALEKSGPKSYSGEGNFPQGSLIFFKTTQGSWDTVEVDHYGYDIQDRCFIARESHTIQMKVDGFARGGARPQPSTRDEHVLDLGYFGEKSTGLKRMVHVHLPPNYETEPKSYPVIYMLDGQNLFDASTAFMGQEWAADKTHDRLMAEKKIQPFIIVGIHNTFLRHEFYTPVRDESLNEGGKLHLLEKMIHEEIEPVLKEKYRIRTGAKNTGVIGSSLGGLAAFHLGWKHPDRYGLIGAMSPSFWWNDYFTYDMVDADKNSQDRSQLKIWMDMGTRESQYMHRPLIAVSRLATLLRRRKFDVKIYIDKDATHSEFYWRKRLEKVFMWLLGKEGGHYTKH